MTHPRDPLWEPGLPADDDLERIELALAPYGVRARGLSMPVISTPSRMRQRVVPRALAAGIAILLLGAGYQYRLAWTQGDSWPVLRHRGGGEAQSSQLRPGRTVATASNETAKIVVARIGNIRLSPDSTLRLVETKTGNHRVSLENGHLRARIWAPPGFFGVRAGSADVVDLGCDFDVWKRIDGSGRVFVRSGWVSYRVGTEDILLPAGYGLNFAGSAAQTPLRPDAPVAFANALRELERVAGSAAEDPRSVKEAARRVASTARDRDAFTLLSLLSRQPALASTALYPRLGAALGVHAENLAHRQAWETGDSRAINEWWTKIPTQPKRWWANWKDALG